MKLFYKILFFLFAIFQTNISEAKVVDVIISKIFVAIDEVKYINETTIDSKNDFCVSCKNEWDFFRSPETGKVGASQPLLDALKEAGIKTRIIELPK